MEFVYVVERRALFELSFPHGFVPAAQHQQETRSYLQRIQRHGFFIERRKAEEDSAFKQIIPYVVVVQNDKVLLLERTHKQGEARLHGKRSIGIGGHINPGDETQNVLLGGMRREIEEELEIRGSAQYRVAGFLNDDSTAVGSVHFGLVVLAHVEAHAPVEIREKDKMEGRFVVESELLELHRSDRARFETWSALLLDQWQKVLGANLPIEQAVVAAA